MVACVAFEDWELAALRETFSKDRWVDKRDRALLALGVSCPARVSEMLVLSEAAVLDESGELAESWHCAAKDNKTRTATDYPISPAAHLALLEWLACRRVSGWRKCDPLFPSRSGGKAMSRKAAWQMVKRRCAAAGLKTVGKGTHSMKHTAISNAYDGFVERQGKGEVGVDPLRDTQAFSGHKKLESLLHYLRPRREAARREGFVQAAKGAALLVGEDIRKKGGEE